MNSLAKECSVNPVPSDGKRLHPAMGVFLTLSFLVLEVIISLGIFVPAMIYLGLTRHSFSSHFIHSELRGLLIPTSLAGAAGAGAIVFFLTRLALPGSLREGALRPIGWSAGNPKVLLKAACVGLGTTFCIGAVVGYLYPMPSHHQSDLIKGVVNAGAWQRALWAFFAVVVAPPTEEFIFRGVLWSSLRYSLGVPWAGVIVSFLFWACHAPQFSEYWPASVFIAFLSIGTVILRARTGSLMPPLVLHVSYNLGLVLLLYLGYGNFH